MSSILSQIGYEVGAEAGARIGNHFGIRTSGDTVLRVIRKRREPEIREPRIVGIDDWAFKKGFRYGTIIVDLERRCPIDLLPNRQVETVAEWLRQHPHIEIIARDRSQEYAQAATLGAPQAIQVADRWHLLKNAGEALQKVLEPYATQLRKWASKGQELPVIEAGDIPEVASRPKQQIQSAAKRAARLERYQQVHLLYQWGWRQKAIAEHLDLCRKTVSRYLAASVFPERQPRRSRSELDPFKAYLLQRWNEGCPNAVRLKREIQEQGFTGSQTLVRDFIARLRQVSQPLPLTISSSYLSASPLTPRRATYLLLSPQPASDEEYTRFLDQFFTLFPALQPSVSLFQAFATVIRGQQADTFSAWLQEALTSDCISLRKFARGLQADEAAVRAALTLPWSSGQSEGQINRLKFIKRQGYGRAKFDLLRRRVLHPISLHDNCG